MVEIERQTAPLANLAAIVGIDGVGLRVVEEIERLLRSAPEAHRRCLLLHGTSDVAALREEIETKLLAQKNLARIAEEYQILGRNVGQPLELFLFVVAHVDFSEQMSALDGILAQCGSVTSGMYRIGVPIGGSLEDLRQCALARRPELDLVLPFPAFDPVAGHSPEADVVASAARAVLVLSAPGQTPLTSLRSAGSARRALRASGAYADGRGPDLLESMGRRVAARLLRLQFEAKPSGADPVPFDEEHRTTLGQQLEPAKLSTRLLAATPFVLDTAREPWRLALPAGQTAVELHGVPRRRWIVVLRKLKHFFDFTKARRWREALEEARDQLVAELEAAIAADVEALHHSERGADRVLAWCDHMRSRLDQPLEIAEPAQGDFDAALASLEQELASYPSPVPVITRIALLTLLAAGVLRLAVHDRWGLFAGAASAAVAGAIGGLFGVRLFKRAHSRLMKARSEAIGALAAHYEAQMRQNLLLALQEVRTRIEARLAEIKRQTTALASAATERARQLEEAVHPPPETRSAVQVVVPPELEAEFLDHLSVKWASLHSAAARAGVLVPKPGVGGELSVPDEAVIAFARSHLESQTPALELSAQLDFRGRKEPSYLAELVGALDEQSRVPLTGSEVRSTTWLGPDAVLSRVREVVAAAEPHAELRTPHLPMLGCLRIARLSGFFEGEP